MKNIFTTTFLLLVSVLSAQQWKWVKTEGTGSSHEGIEYASSVKADNLGNVYVVYRFAANSNPHYEHFFGNDTTSCWKDGEMFMAKYDSNGVRLWHRALTQYIESSPGISYGTLEPQAMEIDNNGFIYITGGANLHSMIFDQDTISTDNNLTSVFILKCDTASNPIWLRLSRTLPPSNSNIIPISYGMDINLDNNGNVIVAGQFMGITVFGNDTIQQLNLNTTTHNGFVTKYDNAGNCLWTKMVGSQGVADVSAACPDNLNNILIGGFSGTGADFDGHQLPQGGYVIKLDSSGNFIWLKPFPHSVTEIAFDSIIYIGSEFSGTMVLDSTSYSDSNGSLYIAQLDNTGSLIWLTQFPGTTGGKLDKIDLLNHELYVAGLFRGSHLFGSTSLNSIGFTDFWVSKCSNAGQILWVTTGGTYDTDLYADMTIDNSGLIYVCGELGSSGNIFGSITANVRGTIDAMIARVNNGPHLCGFCSINPSQYTTTCTDDSLQFTSESGFSSYLWNTSDTTANIWVNSSGTYYYYATDSSGCLYLSPSVMVYAFSPVQIHLSPGDTLFSSYGYGNQWLFNGQIISGANNIYYVPTLAGYYSVVDTIQPLCNDTSNVIYWNSVGQLEEMLPPITFYPNPVNSKIYINGFDQGDHIIIHSIEGKVILLQECSPVISFDQFPTGVYFIRIYNESEQKGNFRIIKE